MFSIYDRPIYIIRLIAHTKGICSVEMQEQQISSCHLFSAVSLQFLGKKTEPSSVHRQRSIEPKQFLEIMNVLLATILGLHNCFFSVAISATT
jgi:hypothetical protein